MRRIGGLYPEIYRLDTLTRAYLEARRGKRHRPECQVFEAELEANLAAIGEALRTEQCRFGDYTVFKVYEPKERLICAAPFAERIVHHAMILVCGSIMERSMIDDTYACRKGKGQMAAVHRALTFIRHYPWCLKLDIVRYFDSIDHGTVMKQLERKFKDTQLLVLWQRLLESYETAPGKGLPIGNLTSQYLANMYLSPFDRFAGSVACRGYVRYMDDMLVFGEYEDLKALLAGSADFLNETLALTIKHGGSLHRSDRGVDFLGYRLLPGRLLLNHRSKVRFQRKYRCYGKAFEEGMLTELEYQERLTALLAFVEQADTHQWRKSILQEERHGQPRSARRELEQQRVERDVREP